MQACTFPLHFQTNLNCLLNAVITAFHGKGKYCCHFQEEWTGKDDGMRWPDNVWQQSLLLINMGALLHTSLFNQDVPSALSLAQRQISYPGGLIGRSPMPKAAVSSTMSSPLPCKFTWVAIHHQLEASATMVSLKFSWNWWVLRATLGEKSIPSRLVL